MGMNIGYRWNVYPLADELKKGQDDPQVTSEELLQQTNGSLTRSRITLERQRIITSRISIGNKQSK